MRDGMDGITGDEWLRKNKETADGNAVKVCGVGYPGYPLVNIQKTMENHHFQWENSL